MPVIIPKEIRTYVIQEWLSGKDREEIKTKYDISTGTISNIVSEWRNELGAYTADSLRELAVAMKKMKLTPERCAIGFRVSRWMQKIGIWEEDFEYFLSEVYNKCELLEISANDIGNYLIEIINVVNIVLPSKIPEYLEKKKKEIKIIEQQYSDKKERLNELEKKISEYENRLEKLLETEKTSFDTIRWYNSIRQELEKDGIPIKDIDSFVTCIKGIKNLNYEAEKVVKIYSYYESFNDLIKDQKMLVEKQRKETESLEFRALRVKEDVGTNELKLSKLNQLEFLGFGLEELRHLHNILSEVARENNISARSAINKFFEDLKDYDIIFGFQDKIKKQVEENKNLSIQISTGRSNLLSQNYTGSILQNLLGKGITEKDIVDINAILSFSEHNYLGKDNLIKSLIQDLDKYRSIRYATILIENSKKDLEKQNIILENQKRNNETNLYFIWLLSLTVLRELQKLRYFTENPTQVYLLYIANNSNKNTNLNLKEKSKKQNNNDSIEDNQQSTKID